MASSELFRGSKIPGLDPDLDDTSGAQKNMLMQMSQQASPQAQAQGAQMPAPPSAAPASQVPVPDETIDKAQMAQLAQRLKQYDTDRQREQDQLREYAKNYQQMDQGTDYRPAAAFIQSLPGASKDLLKAAEDTAPETAQKRAENVIANQQALAKLVGDSGATSAMMKLMQNQQRNDLSAQKTTLAAQRFEYQGDKEARAKFDGDKILNQYTPVVEGANRAAEMIQAAQTGKIKATGQFLNQLNGEITKLERGNNGAIAQEGYDKSAYGSQIANLKALISSYTGKPKDAIPPDLMKVISDNVVELAGSYKKGVSDRFDFLQSGLTPRQQSIATEKRATFLQNLSKRGAFSGGDQVTVSNGTETHVIPRSSLAGAQADNFYEVKGN